MIRNIPKGQAIALSALLIAAIAALTDDLSPTTAGQIVMILIVLAVPASALGGKTEEGYWQRPGLWTWVYIACYVATHALSNTFWLIYYDVIAAPGAHINLQGARYVMALKVYTLHLFILVALYLGVHFLSIVWVGSERKPLLPSSLTWSWRSWWPWLLWRTRSAWRQAVPSSPPDHDLQSKIVLLILLLAEGFAALEYVECKIFEPYAVAVAKTLGTIPPEYACQRALTPLAPYAAPVVTSCYLVWVNFSAWKRSKT